MTSWPGKKMTDKGNNIFDIEVPDGAKYVIFNNGDSQTDDLRIADGNKIYSNGSWQNYSTVKPTQPTTAPSPTVRPTTIATQLSQLSLPHHSLLQHSLLQHSRLQLSR